MLTRRAEKTLREQLATVTRAVVASVDASRPIKLTSDETERLLAVANLVTLARSAAERDYRGDVVDVHLPEVPTRFLKQLGQMMRGAVAIGLPRDQALNLALRCARDSMPPLRLRVFEDVAAHPNASTSEVRKRLRRPRATVDRELQALDMLEVSTARKNPSAEVTGWGGGTP